LTPNPIRKVLSTLRAHQVCALLMGGQACVFYGGAEFSRNTHLAVLPSPENLERLRRALAELLAEPIAVPPLAEQYLLEGHAVHVRCHHPEAAGIRVDVMAVMRGVAPFEALWDRRTTIEDADGQTIDLLSLPDLVAAKKTQRDKDWPMIRRMLEAHYLAHRGEDETPARVTFWLRELRTPLLLVEVTGRHADQARAEASDRPAVAAALAGNEEAVAVALADEERRERELDRAYWRPLREALERLRHQKEPSRQRDTQD
jgi:hypothetical protein